MSMRRIILSSVACLAVPFFVYMISNSIIVGKNLLNMKCVFRYSLQLLSETFLILKGSERDITINVY